MEQEQTQQRASDIEIEMARTMLRIAADIDHLDDLTDQSPGARLGSTNDLSRTAERLRRQVEQAAALSRCPLLRQVADGTSA